MGVSRRQTMRRPVLKYPPALPAGRKSFVGVPVAIGQSRAVDDHAVVEQCAVAFFDGLQFGQPGCDLRNVILVDLTHLLHQVRFALVVSQRMVAVRDPELAIRATCLPA